MRDWCSSCQFENYGASQEPCYNCVTAYNKKPSEFTPATDEVRGVVHCKDCKFWRRPPSCEGLARCETGETGIRYRSKNDFCSRGVKMEATE